MPYIIGIVGAGPRFLYVLERLSAILTKEYHSGTLLTPVEIHVYDPSGQFGPGCHNVDQPDSNWLNVIARHISRTPDTTVYSAKLSEFPSIITEQRLYQFIQKNLGEPEFDPDDYPQRKKLGLFYQHAVTDIEYSLLKHKIPVTIIRKSEIVIDIIANSNRRKIISCKNSGERTTTIVDYAILTTGHPTQSQSSQWSPELENYVRKAKSSGHKMAYISNNLDVRQSMSIHSVPPGSSIGLQGEGLDAIDKILNLTEGRGGHFIRNEASELIYKPSKQHLEPSQILTFSDSNIWVTSKGRNEKGDAQYQAHFFTFEAIKNIRAERLKNSGTSQLDFESDIFPLIYMDMAFEFYHIRQGKNFARKFFLSVTNNTGKYQPKILTPQYFSQLKQAKSKNSAGPLSIKDFFIKNILIPLTLEADYFYYYALMGREFSERFILNAVNNSCLTKIFPSGKKPFSLLKMISPFYQMPEAYLSLELYRKHHIHLLKSDIKQGKAGNQSDPEKAAATALNDMVNNIRMLVDNRGLTARSEQFFREVFHRSIFSKLAPAVPVKNKEKILALINAGILNISLGKNVSVERNPHKFGFILKSPVFKEIHHVDHLSIARIPQITHLKNPEHLPPPYNLLVSRGEMCLYLNKDPDGYEYGSGSIDVNSNWHPIKKSGTAHDNLIILGIPTENIHWHSNLVARTHSESTAWSQAACSAFMVVRHIKSHTHKLAGTLFKPWNYAHSLPSSEEGKQFKNAAQILEERQFEKGFEDAEIIDMSQGDPGSEPILLVKQEMHRAIDFMPFGKYRFDVIPHCYRISIFRYLVKHGVNYKKLIKTASANLYKGLNVADLIKTIDQLIDDPDISGKNLFLANYYHNLALEQHQPCIYGEVYSRRRLVDELKVLASPLNLSEASKKLKILSQSIKKLKILSGTENCKAALANCLRIFSGEYVLCPSGIYQAFSDLPANMNKEWQIIDTTDNEDYKITPSHIEQWLTKNSKKANRINCLFMTDPSNPTGAIYTCKEKLALVTLCRKHGIPIVEDSVYSGIAVSDISYTSITALYPEGSISFKSMGKLFSSPALRLGFAYGAPDFVARFSTYTRNTTGFLPSIPAVGAAAILEYTSAEYYEQNNMLYRRRMDFVQGKVNDINNILKVKCHKNYTISVSKPKGGYFLLINMPCLKGQLYSYTDSNKSTKIGIVKGSMDITRLFIHYKEKGAQEIAVRLPPTTSQAIFDGMFQVRISVGRDSLKLLEEGLRRIEHILIGNYHKQEKFRSVYASEFVSTHGAKL